MYLKVLCLKAVFIGRHCKPPKAKDEAKNGFRIKVRNDNDEIAAAFGLAMTGIWLWRLGDEKDFFP